MTTYYAINKLCKITQVSVRTLHYYDEINLLKPSHRTAKGHRLYSELDLLKLQQIVTFRFLGFSLSQIQKIMKVDKENMFHHIRLQAQAIAEEAQRIDKVSKFFNYLVEKFDSESNIDWETSSKIIEVLKDKKSNSAEWYQKYLSRHDAEHVKKFARTRTDKWLALFEEVKANLHTDPCGEVGKKLVKKWIDLADQAYGSKPELRDKLWQGYQAGLIPNNYFPYDKDVINYLARAFGSK